jgi:uncharacterized protein
MPKLRKAIKSEPACIIQVRVVPRSSQIKILQEANLQFKIKLTSPPVDQAANQQLLEILAKKLSVPPRNIEIISGMQSRNKRIQITGMNEQQVAIALAAR